MANSAFPAGRRYCGTVRMHGLMVDVYEVRLLEFSDGRDFVQVTENEAIGIISGEEVIAWRG